MRRSNSEAGLKVEKREKNLRKAKSFHMLVQLPYFGHAVHSLFSACLSGLRSVGKIHLPNVVDKTK